MKKKEREWDQYESTFHLFPLLIPVKKTERDQIEKCFNIKPSSPSRDMTTGGDAGSVQEVLRAERGVGVLRVEKGVGAEGRC